MDRRSVNLDIRDKARANGLALWQVADALGIADTTFSRWLRKELDKETKTKVLSVIDSLKVDKVAM